MHLSDAAKTCSPRTFLTAWKAAAEHGQLPSERAVDHLGLIDGVRKASTHRLTELREDYPWVDLALVALRGQFVPILRDDLFKVWKQENVLELIKREAGNEPKKAPIGLLETAEPLTLLSAMKSIAVMEERSNGKINVPDIFRVEAGIKRKGGVAVPRKG